MEWNKNLIIWLHMTLDKAHEHVKFKYLSTFYKA